jgi:DNA replication and repair protein RecF
MFFIHKIALTQFRNYDFSSFDFTERVVGICGLNGKGKTNLLDAAYYACFTRSYFTKADAMNMQFNSDGFRIELKASPAQDIVCIYRAAGKKEVSLNGIAYTKLSEHIGKFPAVMIAPDDISLITGGSEERRRYLDMLLSQVDADYLQHLVLYNKVLQQRNSLLKMFAEQGRVDLQLLDVLDAQLLAPGTYIFEKRKTLAFDLVPLVQQFYGRLADNNETVTLEYESKLLEERFEVLLQNYRQKDMLAQRTNTGIHKDEISFLLNGHVFKNTASQGQRKSLLFALKLAEFEILRTYKQFTPLLLLDDVFEKLDDNRMRQLLSWVCIENDGQVLITDTHRERLEEAFEKLETKYQIVEL